MAKEAEPYPGEVARAEDVFQLAEAYHKAADVLLDLGRQGAPLSRAPFRLNAIHAIELYLNALLLSVGLEPAQVRQLQHDLGAREERVREAGLVLRSRTAAHLVAMARDREYLVSRYEVEQAGRCSQINRLAATLAEVRKKVAGKLGLPLDRPAPRAPQEPPASPPSGPGPRPNGAA